jgi:hypothetical protein
MLDGRFVTEMKTLLQMKRFIGHEDNEEELWWKRN